MTNFFRLQDWFDEHTKAFLVFIPILFLLVFALIALVNYDAEVKKEIEIIESESGQLIMIEGYNKKQMLEKFEKDYAGGYEFISIGKDSDGEYIFVLSRLEEN